jgi:hypothetical protein
MLCSRSFINEGFWTLSRFPGSFFYQVPMYTRSTYRQNPEECKMFWDAKERARQQPKTAELIIYSRREALFFSKGSGHGSWCLLNLESRNSELAVSWGCWSSAEKNCCRPGDSPGFLTDCLLSILFFGGYMYRTCCCVLLNCCVYMPRSQKGPLWRVFSFSFFSFSIRTFKYKRSPVSSVVGAFQLALTSRAGPAIERESCLRVCIHTWRSLEEASMSFHVHYWPIY